jgi:signal transduction histidine kinase
MSILRSLSSIVRNSNEVFMQHLAQQNLALERAYVDLKSAQDKLITNERLSNLGKFASFILHDLRNPIAAIRGYAEMVVLEDEQQAALTQYAKKIVQEADHVNRFANDILDYSRGQIRLVYKLITVESLLAKLRVYTQEAMWRRNIAFEVVNSANQEIYVDEDRILRALINIVDNARKACSVGGRVSVTAEIELSNLLLTVSDNGEGMADEVLANIFEPFYSSSKQGGTGLGMLIVKSIVEAHGGHVAISSKLGVGTKIVLIIPVKP